MKAQFRLLTNLLPVDKRQPTDRQMGSAEIQRTAKWHECPKCGDTWSLDEGDTCDWCEPTE
jgi:hypothetical protein